MDVMTSPHSFDLDLETIQCIIEVVKETQVGEEA